jgi:hypothetical protein
VPGRRSRGDRRLRERGRPGWATVTGATAAGDGAWRLDLQVEPADAPAFAAHAEVAHRGPEGPPVGGLVEVVHDGRPGRVLAIGAPSRPPEPPSAAPPPAPAPDLAAVARALVRAAADGSLRQGAPIVLRDEGPGGGR